MDETARRYRLDARKNTAAHKPRSQRFRVAARQRNSAPRGVGLGVQDQSLVAFGHFQQLPADFCRLRPLRRQSDSAAVSRLAPPCCASPAPRTS